jgi:polysaccharide pyruvyl transferase CsaB
VPSNNLSPLHDTVIVSGYYGFNNLGDEAILEQLIVELKTAIPGSRIVVLSNDPNVTSKAYGVLSVSRWDLGALLKTLPRCRLFISGGGGLFQDVQSIKSIVYYGAHILLARFYNCPVLIYAQGLGPLNKAFSKWFTRFVFKQANAISVRDYVSINMLSSWGLKAKRTADPVWCLQTTPLPGQIREQLIARGLSKKQPGRLRAGVCLREFAALSGDGRAALLNTIASAMPAGSLIMPLVLQPLQDMIITKDFEEQISARGHDVVNLDYAKLSRPSQWLELFSDFDLVISMRLHALIMALKSGVPVIGIAYDPKVSSLMQEFDQPCINLLNEHQPHFDPHGIVQSWLGVLRYGLANIEELRGAATVHAKEAQVKARQNFELIATISQRGA